MFPSSNESLANSTILVPMSPIITPMRISGFRRTKMLLLFQDCKSSQTKTQNYLDKSRVKFRSRVRVQQQRNMTETRNNCQDVHDVTQLEMSLTPIMHSFLKLRCNPWGTTRANTHCPQGSMLVNNR